MTIRFLGLSDEQRLAIEETTGIKTEGAQIIVDAAVEQANEMMAKAIREVQEVVGPHGSVTRLQAGGVRITPGAGVSVFEDGVLKTTIEPDGDFLAGSNITDPTNTTFAVFVNEQTYNNETMGAGDLLIGDNTSGSSNVKYDASEGQLQFRFGSTVNVYMDTDGSLRAGAGSVRISNSGIQILESVSGIAFLTFLNSAGDTTEVAFLVADGNLQIQNKLVGGQQLFKLKLTDTTSPALTLKEDPLNTNTTQLDLGMSTNGGKITIGSEVVIWASKDGTATVFNEGSYDIDFRIESATNANALLLDAGAETISLVGDVVVDGGTEHRLEIGTDHYIPTRNSSNKTTIFNEANQDMDFNVQGDTDDDLLFIDASTDRVGIGTATPGYKLDIDGSVNVASGNTYKINGTNVIVTNGDSHDHNGGDGGTIPAGGISAKAPLVLGGHGNGGTIPASTTYHLTPYISGLDTVGRSSVVPVAGTIKKLYFRLATNQPASGSLVIEVYGGASGTTATGVKITIAAGGAAGTYSDTSNTYSHAAGDLVAIKIINNATGASGTIGSASFELDTALVN